MNKEKINVILQWATLNRAEDSFQEEFYYWTPEAKKIFNGLTILGGLYGNCLLIGVRGSSGVGKSALLRALREKLYKWLREHKGDGYGKIFVVKWGERHVPFQDGDYDNPESYESRHSILVDTPDYGRRDLRKINRDLTQISNIWSEVRKNYEISRKYRDPKETGVHQRWTGNFVIFLQKELIKSKDHFFLRKMDIVELKPLTSDQLLEAFRMRFTSYEPFNDDSLTLIAELSRGIFRRFMRYIQLTLEHMIEQGAKEITVDAVKAVITDEILMEDMELEFFDMFRNEQYMKHAVKILNFLRDVKEADQRTIAENVGVHPTILGRIILTLEENNYLKRRRGKGKEWRVVIQ